MKTKLKAFTLVELLVVIAIIGLIASLSIIALSNARSKSRDSKRVSDIKQVQTALELFFSDQGRYPTTAEWNSGSLAMAGSMGTTTYMDRIPSAPSTPDGTCVASENSFTYKPSADGSSYGITFCLGQATGSMAKGKKCATPGGITNDYCRTSLVAGTGTYTLNTWAINSANKILNGGSSDTTDFVDTNSDGIADNFTSVYANSVYSIVTGNGFTGRAQRNQKVATGNSGIFYNTATDFNYGRVYNISLKYRSNAEFFLYRFCAINGWFWYPNCNGTTLPVNTGNAVSYSGTFVNWGYGDFLPVATGGSAGDWYELDEISITEVPQVETVVNGTEYIQNTVAGTISIPSTQAYGTWEWDFYKGGDSNVANFILNGQTATYDFTSAYAFQFSSQEYVALLKDGGSSGGFITNNSYSYMSYNVWYKAKVIRSLAGQFTVLVKGPQLTPTAGYDGWTLALALTGSNPRADTTAYTSSNYFVIDLDAGDRVANISFNGQPVYLTLP